MFLTHCRCLGPGLKDKVQVRPAALLSWNVTASGLNWACLCLSDAYRYLYVCACVWSAVASYTSSFAWPYLYLEQAWIVTKIVQNEIKILAISKGCGSPLQPAHVSTRQSEKMSEKFGFCTRDLIYRIKEYWDVSATKHKTLKYCSGQLIIKIVVVWLWMHVLWYGPLVKQSWVDSTKKCYVVLILIQFLSRNMYPGCEKWPQVAPSAIWPSGCVHKGAELVNSSTLLPSSSRDCVWLPWSWVLPSL